MREIKFRAWDGGQLGQVAVLNMGNLVSFVGSANDFFIAKNLMQYTGLKDKNGVEIYEGDIVKSVLYGDIGHVFYKGSMFLVSNKRDDGYMATVHKNYEVIGNIYEDKQLLE